LVLDNIYLSRIYIYHTKDYLKEPIPIHRGHKIEIYAGIVVEDVEEVVVYFYKLKETTKHRSLYFEESNTNDELFGIMLGRFERFGKIDMDYSNNQSVTYTYHREPRGMQFSTSQFSCNLTLNKVRQGS
jgi:hypothetical protein